MLYVMAGCGLLAANNVFGGAHAQKDMQKWLRCYVVWYWVAHVFGVRRPLVVTLKVHATCHGLKIGVWILLAS